MGKLSFEIREGEAIELSEPEISLIHNSLVSALSWGVLNRPETASAKTCDRLISARANNPHYNGSMIIRYRHAGAIATALDEREGHEIQMEDDRLCPRDQLLPSETRQLLVGLRQILPSESDMLWKECYSVPVHAQVD